VRTKSERKKRSRGIRAEEGTGEPIDGNKEDTQKI
jgi:hypothetical protein